MTENRESRYLTPLLFFTALVLRIPGLNRPFIMDEPKAIEYTSISFKTLIDRLLIDSQPPLYYCVLKFWALISTDVFFLRLLTVLLGSFACIILYETVKIAYTKQAACYAFVLAALSPQLIFQSQYLRPYCMGTFLSVLLVYVFVKFMNNNEKVSVLYYFGLLSIVTALCLYSFYMSIFIIFALNIFAIYFFRKSRIKLLVWIGSQIAAALLFSFWVPVFLSQKYLIEKGITCHLVEIDNAKIGFYIGKFHIGDIIRIILAYFHFDDILGQAKRYSEYVAYKNLFLSAAIISVVPIFFCVSRAIKMMFKTERTRGASALFLLLIAIPAVSFMIFSIGGDLNLWGHAVVNIRYFSQSSIYVLIIFSLFLISMRKGLLRKTLFSCAVIFFLALDLNIYQYPGDIYKPAISYLSDENRDCKVVVLGPPNALGFFNPLSDKRFSDYRIYEYDDSDRAVKEIKQNISTVGGLYFYYFKSAENMVIFPDLDSKFERLARGLGFVKKDEKKVSDILIISYFEKDENDRLNKRH